MKTPPYEDDTVTTQQHNKTCIKAQRRCHYAVAAATVVFLLCVTFVALFISWRYFGFFDVPTITNHENKTSITPTMITSRTTKNNNTSSSTVSSNTLSSMQRENMLQAKIIKCSNISWVNELNGVYLGTTSEEEVTLVQPDCQAMYNLLPSSKSRGVWYRILGQGSCVTVSTCHDNTNFDTRIRVFRIDNAAATISRSSTINESTQLEEIICIVANDDFLGMGGFEQEPLPLAEETIIMPSSVKKGIHHQCSEFTHSSAVTFHMQDNIWYYIFVDGFDEPDHGNFGLSVICDSCSSSATLTPTNAPTTLSPTSTPTFSPATDEEIELLVSFLSKVSSKESLRDTSSPQGQAVPWIIEEFDQWRPHLLFKNNSNVCNPTIDNRLCQQHQKMTQNVTITSPKNAIGRLIERYIFVVLYYTTVDKDWANLFDFLNHTTPICDWASYRIRCDDDNKQVQQINLAPNGPIPTELGLLSELEKLNLVGNGLTGTLPSELGQLSKLKSLSMFGITTVYKELYHHHLETFPMGPLKSSLWMI